MTDMVFLQEEEPLDLNKLPGNPIDIDVVINEDAKTPAEYFDLVKSKVKIANEDVLKEQLEVIAGQILRAKEINQKAFLHRLSFTYETIVKEQAILANGFNKYVLKNDIQHFIDNVQPKNSVKIIELDRFPRAIPEHCLDEILRAKTLGIFSEFVVVFTDFTKNDYKTPQEKEFIAKNRDPIVFGYFKTSKNEYIHDRFYLITDWIDEYCELDFSDMIAKMNKMGIKNPEKTIDTNSDYLLSVVADAMKEMEQDGKSSFSTMSINNNIVSNNKPNFFIRMWHGLKRRY